MVEVYHPQTWEAWELCADLRDQDKAELEALGIDRPEVSVAWGIDNSAMCWAARVDGKLACIFGVTSGGVVWLLGTPVLPENRRQLAMLAPRYIKQMLKVCGRLYNIVHAENSVAVRWLPRMGFRLAPPEPTGPHGALFHPFEMTSHV